MWIVRERSQGWSRFLANRIRRTMLPSMEILKTVGGIGLRMKIKNLF